MNMTRKPVTSVHMMLMAMRLCPTASAISAGVGCPGVWAGMSLTVPVAAPDGSAGTSASAAVAPSSSMDSTSTGRNPRRNCRISLLLHCVVRNSDAPGGREDHRRRHGRYERSEEHTSELQSPDHLVCRLLLEKKNKKKINL